MNDFYIKLGRYTYFQSQRFVIMIRAIFSFVICIAVLQMGTSQQDTLICAPDSAFLASGAIIYPPPFVNDTLGVGIPDDACINEPFQVTFFLNAPSSITLAGVDIEVFWIRVDSVTNLPAGLEIECSVEDCQVFPDSLACIRLSGTPDPSNVPGDYELLIYMTASTNIFPTLPIEYPSETLGAPGSYTVTLLEEGACLISSSTDLISDVDQLNIFPNPVKDNCTIQWQSEAAGTGTIGLITTTGRRVMSELVKVKPGFMSYDMNLAALAPGVYVLDFRSDKVNFRRKILKL